MPDLFCLGPFNRHWIRSGVTIKTCTDLMVKRRDRMLVMDTLKNSTEL